MRVGVFVLVFTTLVFLSMLFLLPTPVNAAEYFCSSCDDCTSKIKSAQTGDIVKLAQDINASQSSISVCIDIYPPAHDSITFDCQGHKIYGKGWYAIYISGPNYIIVKNCTIQEDVYDNGIMINSNSNHCIIDHVVVVGVGVSTTPTAGISVQGTNNTIKNSVFSFYTRGDFGVGAYASATNSTFINVTSKSNKRGLWIKGVNSNFTNMTIDSNIEYGILIEGSNCNSNTIYNSTVRNNSVGIWVTGSNSNLIYNNFFNNTKNAQIDSGTNSWNITKTLGKNIIGEDYLGGNFWSNYSGQDSDGDGLGDSPHELGGNNFDYLSLVHPPLIVNFIYPTPENLSVMDTNWVFVNVSANKVLSACRLEWNGVNESMDVGVSGKYCYKNKTGLNNGNYSFIVRGNISSGDSSMTEKRFVTVNSTMPNILYAIQPKSVVNGSNVSLMINASGPSGIDKTWLAITLPNSTSQTIYLQNRVAINYTTSIAGRYNVTFFANDTSGNRVDVSDYFEATGTVPNLTFILTIESPRNATYVKHNLTANGTLELTVTSGKNISSCLYYVGDLSDSLSKINPKKFQAYVNVSGMEGPYKLIFECTSAEGVANYSNVFFTVYPSYDCLGNNDCAGNQKCVNFGCVALTCECGYASNHACVNYACCDDSKCDNNKFCEIETHACKPVVCDCPEKISSHKCMMEPEYCCKDMQCMKNETCINHECVKRTLSFTLPENIALDKNISLLVVDQSGDPVGNVGIDVKYLDKDPVVIETYYTNSEGIAEIQIKHWGRVDFVARKDGYFTNYNSGKVPEPFNWFFVLEVIILMGCLAGIAITGKRFLKGGLKGGLLGGGPFRLEKTISGERVMLRIKNKTGRKLQELTIHDYVPRGAFIQCNVAPSVEPFDQASDILTWEILELEPKEEVTIEYETRRATRGFSVRFREREYKVE